MRKPIPGHRYFKCHECGKKWKSKTRDCRTPSNETCHNYENHEGEFPVDVVPYDYEIDNNLETDKYGNLK